MKLKFSLKKWWPYLAAFLVLVGVGLYVYFGDFLVKADGATILGDLDRSSISLDNNEIVKEAFKLSGTYYVRVYVVNSKKKVVKKIYASPSALPAGIYTPTQIPALTWNGTNDSGQKVAAGNYSVYFDARRGSRTVARYIKPISVINSGGTQQLAINVNPATFDPKLAVSNIGFTLTSAGKYRLIINDSTNKTIKTIFDYTAMKAGAVSKSWDGKNDAGTVVANGTYTILLLSNVNGLVSTIGNATVTVGSTIVRDVTITVDPLTFNPITETAAITFDLPAAGSYKYAINDSTNTEIKALSDFTQTPISKVSKSWDGKNNVGVTVNDGSYTIVSLLKNSDGTIVRAGSAKVSVLADNGDGYLPTGNEIGNIVEGTFSANFNWFERANNKFGITFTSPKTSRLSGVNIQWKSGGSYGYGAGTWTNPSGATAHNVTQAKAQHGVYTFEIQSNGTGNFPSGTVLASKAGVYPEDGMALASGRTIVNPDTEQCTCDGSLQVNFDAPASLEAGKIYHLTITDTASNFATNWSSPNTLASRINTGAWTGGNNRAEYWDGTRWFPWTTQKNVYQTSTKSNNLDGSHAPTLLRWADGTFSGDPYYSAASQNRHPKLYGSNKMSETIVWNGETTTINKIGLTVFKERALSGTSDVLTNANTPAPAGDLNYHILLPNGTKIEGVVAKGSDMTVIPEWKYVTVTPFTLELGKTYTIWFDSPSSTSTSWYAQDPVYGQGIPSLWLNYTWGGTGSHAVINGIDYLDMDLTLSLQK